MSDATRTLHDGIDEHARRTGIPYLHPDEPTVQLDLLGSAQVVEWQEGEGGIPVCQRRLLVGACLISMRATAPLQPRELIAKLQAIEHATSAIVCDSGMQATALAFDVLMEPGSHAVLMRQVYNKTRSYLEWMAARLGGSVTIVDDGDLAALAAAIKPETRFVFAETFTNPLVRAQDLDALRGVMAGARERAPGLRLVLDSTIATPWAFKTPLLDQGIDIVVASGTKSLGGNDRDLWGYIATNDTQFANAVMDLVAMRGGILDWRRATAILSTIDDADCSARAPVGDRDTGRAVPGVAPEGQRGVSSLASRRTPTPPRLPGNTCAPDRCCRSGSRTRMKSARGTSRTCWRRRSSCDTRCRSTGWPRR